MAELLYRVGRFAALRRWWVMAAWAAVLALTATTFAVFSVPLSSAISIPGTPTTQVTEELAEKIPATSGGSGSIVFETDDGSALSADQRRGIEDLLADIGDLDGVADVVDPFETAAQAEEQQGELAQAERRLQRGETELQSGVQQLRDAQQQLDAQVRAAREAGDDALLAQLEIGQQQLDGQQPRIEQGRAELRQGREQLEMGRELAGFAEGIRFVSDDGSTVIGTVSFEAATTEVPQELKDEITALVEGADIDGVSVLPSNDISQEVPSILGPAEVVGLVIAAIVLLVMLRTVIGAVLPLLSAIVGVGVAVLAAMSFSGSGDFVSVTPVLGVMLGLAVGIDYSLFILNRHRAQLKRGMPMVESIALANGTSGNAVMFAGSTVIVALLALNVTGIPFLGLMGTVGGGAVAVAVLVAVTFTPALLSIVGRRILTARERREVGTADDGDGDRARPMSSGRAVVTLLAGVLALGVVALPATQMRLGLPDGSSEAQDSAAYQAYSTLEEQFGAGQNGPLLVVADVHPVGVDDDDRLALQVGLGRELSDLGDVAALAPIAASDDGTVLAFQVKPEGGPNSESTAELVRAVRDLSPLNVDGKIVSLGVAGNASANIDVSDKLADALPVYLLLVVGLSLLILIVVFRSILVPLTATAGFVLSVLAAFGGITAIYQFGWLGAVFGAHDPAPILSFLPVIQVGILFGLAMDYQLFLVSGMREAYAHGAPPRIAVRRGLLAGRAVVTAAAIIMISVFAGFIFSHSATIRPIGFGLAFGVLVDAFVVRMLLIPAVMHLLGGSAWWLPRWLDRLLPDVDVEGAKLERAHPEPRARVTDVTAAH